MRPEEWSQIKALFDEAVELPPGERGQFLASRCDNPGLRRQVSLMLVADGDTAGDLDEIVRDAAGDSFAPTLGADQTVGAYRIIKEIGSGGMGAVYLAERADETYAQRVAIKVTNVALAGPQVLSRFRSERQILASLEHPNIARLIDGGTTESGTPYLVMEYVDGEPIDLYCDRREMNTLERLRLFQQVCGAIHVAHQNLIVHRDIKPDNILVTADGVPKLLDFGIAKLLDPNFSGMTHAVTQANMRLFTPKYASPEQVMGKTITTASDIYSLGVLLYELLVGRSPYAEADESQQRLLRAICENEPQRPSTLVHTLGAGDNAALLYRQRNTSRQRLRKRLRGDLDNIVLMAMRKEPERRYESARRLAADIDNYLHDRPVIARQDTFSYRVGKYVRRNAAAVAVSASALVAVVTLVTFYTIRLAQERDRAQTAAVHATQTAEFLQNLFRVTDPEVAKGEDVTARSLLEQGTRQLETTLADQPQVRAMLQETIGKVYTSMGLLDDAQPLLESSLATQTRLFGANDPSLAPTLRTMAQLATQQGRLDEALTLAGRAIDLSRRELGEHHPDTADKQLVFAIVLEFQGRYEESLEVLSDARASLEAGDATDHPVYPSVLAQMASVYEVLGDFDAAIAISIEALQRQRDIHGRVHPEIVSTQSNLALLLDRQHRYGEAEAYYLDIMDVIQQLYGDVHPAMSDVQSDLGRVYRHAGDADKAMHYLRTALETSKKVYGDKHSFVAYDMVAVANYGYKTEGMAFAEPLFREALDIYEETLPENHPYKATALVAFSSRLLSDNRIEEAQAAALRGKEICAASLPADHWLAAQMDIMLGMSERRLGNEPAATAFLLDGYERLKAGRGLEHGATQSALRELLANLQAVGDDKAHASYLDQLVDAQ